MWFPLRVDVLIAKKIVNDSNCIIYLSDFKRIWYKSLQNYEILSIAKKLNPLFEAPDQKLIEITLGLINDNEDITKTVRKEESNLILTLESNILGVRFQFQIKLSQGDEEMFYNELTLPLLLMTVKMKKLNETMTSIIEKKNLELESCSQKSNMKTKNCVMGDTYNEREFVNESVNSLICKVIGNPSFFLDYVDKKLLCSEIDVKNESDISSNSNLEKKSGVLEDNERLVSNNKNLTKKINQCVQLCNQTIKKRKKQETSSRIRI